MTLIVVNDASCLIDLRKGKLLHEMLRLPYRFIVPLPIREEELLGFTPEEWLALESRGLLTYDLPGTQVASVAALKRERRGLSANDCFALMTAMCHEGAVLLTGDGLLRKAAVEHAVRVHGVLWVVKQLHGADICEPDRLIAALNTWKLDESVFLPRSIIAEMLHAIRRK